MSAFETSLFDLKAEVEAIQRKLTLKKDDESSAKLSQRNVPSSEMLDEQLVVDLSSKCPDRHEEDHIRDIVSDDDHSDSDTAGPSFAKVGSKDNSKLSIVNKDGRKAKNLTKKLARESVYANKDVPGSNSKLRAVTNVRSWHCKISHIESGISIDDVVQYIKEQGITPILVEALPQRGDAPLSMHIVVSHESKDDVM